MKRSFLLGIALVLGLLAIGDLAAQTDRRLNGTWAGIWQGYELEYNFNNGNYEIAMNNIASNRGTYTTNNGEIQTNPTHFFGGVINATLGTPVFESKWYSRNEFIIAFRSLLSAFGASESEMNEIVMPFISPPPSNYSVEDNSLILTFAFYGERHVVTLNRK